MIPLIIRIPIASVLASSLLGARVATNRCLGSLPDETLPELDAFLVNRLEKRDSPTRDLDAELIGRYSTVERIQRRAASTTPQMTLELHIRQVHEKTFRNLQLQENRLARRREREMKELRPLGSSQSQGSGRTESRRASRPRSPTPKPILRSGRAWVCFFNPAIQLLHGPSHPGRQAKSAQGGTRSGRSGGRNHARSRVIHRNATKTATNKGGGRPFPVFYLRKRFHSACVI